VPGNSKDKKFCQSILSTRDERLHFSGSPPVQWLGLGLGVWMIAAALRLLEWPSWMNSGFWRDGSPVLPNPDSYAWLAGAEGNGRLTGWPMSDLIAMLTRLTGQSPEWVAFWMPVALAGATGVLLSLLCACRGHWSAGWVAGIFGASSLGFLGRTRLGNADTDLFALPLAVALAWAWAVAIRQLVTAYRQATPAMSTLLPLCTTAFVCSLFAWLYPSAYPLMLSIILFGMVFVWWRGEKPARTILVATLAALLLTLHFGLTGLALALSIVAGFVLVRPLQSMRFAVPLLTLAIVAVVWMESVFLEQTLRRVGAYTGLELAVPMLQDWRLPGVEDSIAETGGVRLVALAERVANHWLLLLAGLLGFFAVLRRWPELVTFVPLLILGLAGSWLGVRFSMYAAPPLALGLGLGLALLLLRLGARRWPAALTQGTLAAGILLLIGWRALEPTPSPFLTPSHADALTELRHASAHRGRVWTWWDSGYTAQFYTAMPTLADGASASRERMIALGQVFGAMSPLQASQVMKLGAMARVDATEETWLDAAYRNHPLQMLAGMPAELAQAELDRLARSGRLWPEGLPDEFLVVDWRTLRQAQWISYFGRWRLDEGERGYGQIQTLQPPVELDSQRGLLHTAEGPVALLSIDILERESHYHNTWQHAQGAHAVINNVNGQGVLMDSDLYGQMAVQMLIGEPAEFEPHFELIIDRRPDARIYRVR
jgi:hypothetical protein